MGIFTRSTRHLGHIGIGLLLVGGVALGQVPSVALGTLTEDLAERCRAKFQTIDQHSLVEATKPRRTSISEFEVNSYLKFLAGEQIPVGIVDPTIGLLESGRVEGRATVDLDLVRESGGPRGWLDPLRYLTGRLPVTATGRLTAAAGRGQIALESTTVGGMPVPPAVLRELVAYYTVTPDNPEGYALDEPFDLPYRIQAIQVGLTDAVIVQ